MPFTISHAAAVLPLHRLSKARLPLAALMIGSMAPDFAYFMPGDPGRFVTHSLAGLFTYCLPTSLLLWLLFVRVLEEPTAALLPPSWRSKFPRSDRDLTIKNLALLCAAILIGGITHIVWDSFTHRDTPVTNFLSPLSSVAFEVGGMRLRWFGVLQHLGTLLGLVVLGVWARRLPGRASQESRWSVSNAVRIGASVFMATATVALALANYMRYPNMWFEYRLFFLATGGMMGGALSWIAVSVWIRLRVSASHRR